MTTTSTEPKVRKTTAAPKAESPKGSSLAEALATFQAEMPTVAKGQTATIPGKNGGQGYSYKYADLAAVSAAAMPILTANGLSFICHPRRNDDGTYELAATLLHVSGESIQGALPLNGRTAQEMGSSLTYMRRYLLGCMTGIVTDEDDDGARAQHAAPTKAEATLTKAQYELQRDLNALSVEQRQRVKTWWAENNVPALENLSDDDVEQVRSSVSDGGVTLGGQQAR